MKKLFTKTCLMLTMSFILSSCAVTDYNHLSTTNWVDQHFTSENTVVNCIQTPLFIPVTIVTLVIDNFFIAPAVHFSQACEDSSDCFMLPDGSTDGYYTDMAILPFTTVATPVVFVGSLFGNTIFNPDKGDWPEWGEVKERDENGRIIEAETPSKEETK